MNDMTATESAGWILLTQNVLETTDVPSDESIAFVRSALEEHFPVPPFPTREQEVQEMTQFLKYLDEHDGEFPPEDTEPSEAKEETRLHGIILRIRYGLYPGAAQTPAEIAASLNIKGGADCVRGMLFEVEGTLRKTVTRCSAIDRLTEWVRQNPREAAEELLRYRDPEPSSEINPILFENIDRLELTARSTNCLKAEEIFWIYDLIQKTETAILKIPNLGGKSVKEIKQMLARDNLELGTVIPRDQIISIRRKIADKLGLQEEEQERFVTTGK